MTYVSAWIISLSLRALSYQKTVCKVWSLHQQPQLHLGNCSKCKFSSLPCRPVLPWWLSGKQLACHAGDPGSIPGSGRSPGEGNGNLLQYSGLENPMDRGAWGAIVHGVAESDMTEWLHFTIVKVHSNWVHAAQDYPKRPTYTPFISNIWHFQPGPTHVSNWVTMSV